MELLRSTVIRNRKRVKLVSATLTEEEARQLLNDITLEVGVKNPPSTQLDRLAILLSEELGDEE